MTEKEARQAAKKAADPGFGSKASTTSNTANNRTIVKNSTLKAAAKNVANMEDFSYNSATDPNYRNMASMYQREGARANRDTQATAAAQTGGLGSSYAASAGAQQQNYYQSQLNDNYSTLYNLALNKHNANQSNRINQLNALKNVDSAQQSEALARWQANGKLGSKDAKILGLKKGTLYSSFQQFYDELAYNYYAAQLAAAT